MNFPWSLLGLLLAPLFPGIVNKTKAFFAGRTGVPLLQCYYDLAKLLRKGAVYSRTTSWVFQGGPAVALAAVTAAALLLPVGPLPAALSFPGDCLVFAYLLGLARFAIMLAALDTGSAFEGMGASREGFFSALTELVFFAALILLALISGSFSLSEMLSPVGLASSPSTGPASFFLLASLFVVILAENARVPFDDPNTHLELTMIHEVMVLDHSGPDLAVIELGAQVKLWLLLLLEAELLLPHAGAAGVLAVLGGAAGLAVLIGAVESLVARLQMPKVPQLLCGALALAGLGIVFMLR